MEDKLIPVTSVRAGQGEDLAPDVFMYTNQVVNLFFIEISNQENKWIMVDTGMPKSAETLKNVAEVRYGKGSRPEAIILTHGHFDHVGAVEELAAEWRVPVYAHRLELPYLTGEKNYPEPDSSVEGGLVAKLSSMMFPNEAINLGDRVTVLPEDGTVPHLPEWKWIHTPGHTEGHVSLYREKDGMLLVGDAFVTVEQESLYKVLVQEQEISGPPRYLTTDWKSAWESVKKLHALNPSVAATGHGEPMAGERLASSLEKLVQDFETIAIPDHGRFV
jgi:glyoxylase-like metal-dependent hydrolase (beta-lactamase superfamily II)